MSARKDETEDSPLSHSSLSSAPRREEIAARGNFSFKKKLARISLQRRLSVDEVGDGGGGGACVTREC